MSNEDGVVSEQDAVSKFQQWLREHEYEDAVEVCPYDGREGGFQGAVDAWDVAQEYLDDLEPEPSDADRDKVMAYASDVGQFADPKIWGESVCREDEEDFDEEEWMVEQAISDSENHPSEEEIEASMATISDVDLEKRRLSAEDMAKLGIATCDGKTAQEWRALYFQVLGQLHDQNAQLYSGDETSSHE